MYSICLTRNCLTKNHTQRATSVEHLQDIKVKTESFIEYIAKLKIDTTPIIQTKNKTDFLGLIICLKSVIFLAESLFSENYMTFLLTYKMSQNHLETVRTRRLK